MAQHDYVVDNGSGFGVRTDINDALSAIVSQNSGTEPTATFPYMVWADTGSDILKVRNAADDGWVEIYELSTGTPLSNAVGSSISFDTAQTGDMLAFTAWLADTSAVRTRNLPATPPDNAEVIIIDDAGLSFTNNITVGRNGELIMGSTTDLVIDVNFSRVHLKYNGAAGDWRIISN